MGRNIKFYNGTYTAQTSNNWDAVSTGYTVPSGKIARLGFTTSIKSGYSDYYGACGFFAGSNGAGTTSTGHNTNRFLMIYMPSTDTGGGNSTEVYCSIRYIPNMGHSWVRTEQTNHTPQLYIGDGHRERYTTRSSTFDWLDRNIMFAYNTNLFGTLAFGRRNNTSITSQVHEIQPHNQVSWNSSGYTRANQFGGEPHAVAGETVYLYDWSGPSYYTQWNRRAAGQMQWSMLVIEEDA